MLTDICLYYATIQVSDKLVFQESKDIILNYITECKGKASKNNVPVFMEKSKNPLGIVRIKIPEEFRTSNVTTLGIIKELEDDDRIKVLKGKRHGQSHLLIFNYGSQFKKIDESVTGTRKAVENLPWIENAVKHYRKPRKGGLWLPNDVDTIMSMLLNLLDRTDKIPVQSDAQILEKKIIDLMKLINKKKMMAESKLN